MPTRIVTRVAELKGSRHPNESRHALIAGLTIAFMLAVLVLLAMARAPNTAGASAEIDNAPSLISP